MCILYIYTYIYVNIYSLCLDSHHGMDDDKVYIITYHVLILAHIVG